MRNTDLAALVPNLRSGPCAPPPKLEGWSGHINEAKDHSMNHEAGHAARQAGDATTTIGLALRTDLRPRPVAASIAELLADAENRHPMDSNTHGLSSATFERVTIQNEPHIVKHLHPDDDWVMRATADLTCRAAYLWHTGMMDLLPPTIDHTMVGAASGIGRNGWGAALLMRDVGAAFTPEGDAAIDLEQHSRFLDHAADLHVRFWGFRDDGRLTPSSTRFLILSPWTAEAEATTGKDEMIPRLAGEGWAALAEVSHPTSDLAHALFHDPGPLVQALAATPTTLIHGDLKYGNLGSHPDGRTVLVDWAFPGEGAACADLTWYLGVNCDRLPESKEDTIERYRRALEARGISTSEWWDAQLGLACIGNFLQFGWNKGMSGRNDEFCWWEERVLDAVRFLA